MNYAEDITDLDRKINNAKADAQAAVDSYNVYSSQITDSVNDVLRDAGVFEKVRSLEIARSEVRKKVDHKVGRLNAQIGEWSSVRAYMIAKQGPGVLVEPAAEPAAEEVAPDANKFAATVAAPTNGESAPAIEDAPVAVKVEPASSPTVPAPPEI